MRPGPATFYLKHVLLPHGPHLFLPSGRQSRASWRDALPSMNSTPGFFDDYLTLHNRQRILLQIGFVDRELGRLFDRLRRLRLYDKAMIVVTADHGISSEVGRESRRKTDRRNVDEVAPVPLFIKAPRQPRGRTDDCIRAHHRHRANDGRPARRPHALPRRWPLRRARARCAGGAASG